MMNTVKPSLIINNETLSASYCNSIKRIGKTDIGTESLYKLPKTILIEREHAWDELFEKYSNMQNDSETILRNLNSVSERIDDIDNGSNNEKVYYSKSRTPMRKHPALVQYWVETGNPPYQLVDENQSETGSSLNEEDDMKCGTSAESPHSNGENKGANGTSLFSSVDTVAYILSNTNVTKKSDAIAIIEGAKKTTPPPDPTVNLITNNESPIKSSRDCITEDKTVEICENTNKLNDEKLNMNKEAKSIKRKLIFPDISTDNDKKSLLIAKTIIKRKLSQQNFINAPINQSTHNNCMKITDILPTLANLDRILNSNSKLDKQENTTLNDENSLFENVSKVSNQPKLKKLYTGRDSPIDILMSTFKNRRKFSFKNNSHPALLFAPIISRKTVVSKRSTSLLRQRQRKSLASTTKQSKTSINEESDGNNTSSIINDGNEMISRRMTLTKRQKKLQGTKKKSNNSSEKPSRSYKRNIRKSPDRMCDSDITDDNDELSVNEKKSLSQSKKMTDLIAQCSLKILKIQLERCVVTKSMPNTDLRDDQSVNSLNSLNETSEHDIHNIDDESQESELSTILICKCVNDQEKNVTPKNQNGLLQKIRKNVRNSQLYENININDKQEVTNKIDKMTTTICSESYESDENSLVKLSSTSQHISQPRLSNNIITFSSDEEDDFAKMIRENSEKHKENDNIKNSKREKSFNTNANDCDISIQELTGNFNSDELETSSKLPISINLTIVESDDDAKSAESQQHKIKNVKKSDEKHIEESNNRNAVKKSKLIMGSSSIVNMDKKSAINSVARVLQYESSSDSSIKQEHIDIPFKKLKLDSVKSRLFMNYSTEEYERESKKSSSTNSNSGDTIAIFNKRNPPKKIRKRKIRVHLRNGKNSTVITKKDVELSKQSLPSVEKLNTTSADTTESLDKLKLLPRLTPLCPSTHNKKIDKQEKSIHHDNSVSVIKSENIKNRTRNPMVPKRKNILTSSIKSRSVSSNESSSDDEDVGDDKLNIDNKQNEKLSSIDKKNNESKLFLFNNTSKCIIPSILDDSSGDESLIFEPVNNHLSINRNNKSKTKTMIFQTRFDDSD